MRRSTLAASLAALLLALEGAEASATPDVPHSRVALAPPATASPRTQPSDESGSLQPSLGQALSMTLSATIDAKGLHVHVDVVNRTDATVVATFPSAAQVAFLVYRNGAEVWNSTSSKMFAQVETSLTFQPHVVRSFSDVWPGYAAAGAGSYTVRAQILTEPRLLSSPVSAGTLPAPAST